MESKRLKLFSRYFPDDVSWEIELYADDANHACVLRELHLRFQHAVNVNHGFFPHFYIVSRLIYDIDEDIYGFRNAKTEIAKFLKYANNFSADSMVLFLDLEKHRKQRFHSDERDRY